VVVVVVRRLAVVLRCVGKCRIVNWQVDSLRSRRSRSRRALWLCLSVHVAAIAALVDRRLVVHQCAHEVLQLVDEAQGQRRVRQRQRVVA
jgi:hypothetical protein